MQQLRTFPPICIRARVWLMRNWTQPMLMEKLYTQQNSDQALGKMSKVFNHPVFWM